MSSFASGYLLKQQHLPLLQPAMEPRSYLVACGGDWMAYLVPQGVRGLEATGCPLPLLELSRQAPVLIWDHPEDYGWGFGVLYQQEIKSSCRIDYEDFYEPTYPEEITGKQAALMMIDLLGGGDGDFPEPPTREQLNQTFAALDLSALKLFGLDSGAMARLAEIFTLENLWDDQSRFGMVGRFKQIMGFEMDFISWEKVQDYQSDGYNILARGPAQG